MLTFILNKECVEINTVDSLSVLDYLRQQLYLTGTKESCHQGECGACLVLLGSLENGEMVYQAVTSCLLPLGELQAKHIVTIEGLNQSQLNPLQQAFVDNGAAQCGYCTPGFIVALSAFLLNAPNYTLAEAKLAVSNNLCRCTGYQAIKRAINDLLAMLTGQGLSELIEQGFIPAYFLEIPEKIQQLDTELKLTTNNRTKVGGGTDYFVQHPHNEQALDFLYSHQELKGIYIKDNYCYIGAETSVEELRRSPIMHDILPQLADDLQLFSAQPLRQRASLAGNLVNASPIADLAIIFLSLNAELELIQHGQGRLVALKEFFIDYKQTAKQADELVKCIRIPLNIGLYHYQKVSKRQYLDIASVNSALQLIMSEQQVQSCHIALGGVAATPLYLHQSVEFLQQQVINRDTLMQLLKISQTEISPLSDIHGSSDYKRLLVQQLLIKHFLHLFPEQLNWQELQFQGVLQ